MCPELLQFNAVYFLAEEDAHRAVEEGDVELVITSRVAQYGIIRMIEQMDCLHCPCNPLKVQ